MEDDIRQLLSKIDKKLDRMWNMQTKIAKALHLLPVSEKEERDIQIQQRKNLSLAANVNAQLNAMENKDNEDGNNDYFSTVETIYGDVLGDEFLEVLK